MAFEIWALFCLEGQPARIANAAGVMVAEMRCFPSSVIQSSPKTYVNNLCFSALHLKQVHMPQKSNTNLSISATPGLDLQLAGGRPCVGGVDRLLRPPRSQGVQSIADCPPRERSKSPGQASLRLHFHFQPGGSHLRLSRLSEAASLHIIEGLLTQVTPSSKGGRPLVRTSGAACTDRRRVGAKRIGSGTRRLRVARRVHGPSAEVVRTW